MKKALFQTIVFMCVFLTFHSFAEERRIIVPEWTEAEIVKKPIKFLERIEITESDEEIDRDEIGMMMVLVMQYYGIADPSREKSMIPIDSRCDFVTTLANQNKAIKAVVDEGMEVANFVEIARSAERYLNAYSENEG